MMQLITIPSDVIYSNLYTLTGIASGTSLILTNNTSYVAWVVQAASPPLAESDQYPLYPGKTIRVNGSADPIWVRGGYGPFIVQTDTDSIAPFTAVDFPEERYQTVGSDSYLSVDLPPENQTTIGGENFYQVELPSENYTNQFGVKRAKVDLPVDLYTSQTELYRRIKVDPGQTSFHEGREARTFYEFSIPAGTSIYLRVNVNVNTVLYDVSTVLDAGSVRLTTYAGATGTGVYGTPLPVITKNTMSIRKTPFYVPANQVLTGVGVGITGGIPIDVVRIVAANATAQQTSVGSKEFDQRGVGVGTYYWRLENFGSGTATGVFSSWWAELLTLGGA